VTTVPSTPKGRDRFWVPCTPRHGLVEMARDRISISRCHRARYHSATAGGGAIMDGTLIHGRWLDRHDKSQTIFFSTADSNCAKVTSEFDTNNILVIAALPPASRYIQNIARRYFHWQHRHEAYRSRRHGTGEMGARNGSQQHTLVTRTRTPLCQQWDGCQLGGWRSGVFPVPRQRDTLRSKQRHWPEQSRFCGLTLGSFVAFPKASLAGNRRIAVMPQVSMKIDSVADWSDRYSGWGDPREPRAEEMSAYGVSFEAQRV